MASPENFRPKVVNGECREFIVLPPVGVQFDEPAVQSLIAAALKEAFPDSGFTVVAGDPGFREEDEFRVLPVIEEVEGRRVSRVPKPDVVAEIGDFLNANFADIRAPRLH